MFRPQKAKFKYLKEESYLQYIENSVGSKMFRSYFVKDSKGKRIDVLGNGNVSCGIHVSTILRNFDLIKKLHFTVARTIDDMIDCKWKKVSLKSIRPGDVILWVPLKGETGLHSHAGFYIGKKQAVSNSSKQKCISKHHYTYSNKREVEAVYRPNWKFSYAKS